MKGNFRTHPNDCKYTLLEDFEETGYWWIPGHPAEERHGSLQLRHGQLKILLSGSFSGQEEHPYYYPVLHCRSKNDSFFSAFQCRLTFSETTGKSYPLGTFIPQYVVSGVHILGDYRIAASSARFPGLEDSFGGRGFTETQRTQYTGEWSWEGPPILKLAIESIKAELETRDSISRFRSVRRLSADYELSFVLKSQAAEYVSWHLEHLGKLRKLLNVISGIHLPFVEVRLLEPYKHVTVLFQQEPGQYSTENSQYFNMLLRFSDLSPQEVQEAARIWFSAPVPLHPVIDLFCDLLESPLKQAELQLVNLVQSLEAFHRGIGRGEYLSTSDYEPIKQSLEEAIPSTVPEPLANRIRSALKYCNEFSQRKRLKDLFDGLPMDVRGLIMKDVDAFVASVVNTRNYYIHYDDADRDKVLRGYDLVLAAEGLQLSLNILFLLYLGIEPSKVFNAIKHSIRYSVYRKNFGVE